jgi:hypothetical protein
VPGFRERLYRRVNRDQIGAREGDAPDIFTKLLGMGLEAPEAKQVAKQYVLTGDFDPPTRRSTVPGPQLQDPTVQPIKYKTGKRKQLYTFDKSKGVYGPPVDVSEDVDSVDVREFESDPKNGFNIYVDKNTGAEIRRERNGTRADKVIKIGESSGGAGQSDDLKAAHTTHQKYLEAIKSGKGVPLDLEREMETAAPLLGMEMEDVAAPAEGFIKKVARVTPLIGDLMPPPAQGYRRPVFKTGGGGSGKSLTRELAASYLKKAQAGGLTGAKAKEKARSLAKADGYTF